MRQAVIVGGSQRLYDAPGGAPVVPVDPPDPDPDVVASVSVSPISFSVIAGLDVQALTATPRNDTGGVVAGKTATWVSSDTGVATVASVGNLAATVTAVSTGTTTITATVDGINGTSAGTVLPAVATVTVVPSTISLTVLGTQAVVANVLDSGGSPVVGRNIGWATTDAGVASVVGGAAYSATVTAVGPGTATITATVESASGTAAVTSTAAVSFVDEPFEDAAFASRGWYDMPAGFVLDTVNPHSGNSCVRFTWQPGNNLPDTSWRGRIKFTPTDQVYIEYWVRYSSNWIGSGLAAHPHEWQIVTTEDTDFVGPNSTHLTMSVEQNYQSGLVAKIAATDQLNVDQSNIGVDLTGITEIRAANGCNGFLETSHTTTSCFDSGGGVFAHDRAWDDTVATIPDGAKTSWNKVGAFIKLNSVTGGTAQQNGIIRYWINDTLQFEHTGVVLRTGQFPSMLFDQLLLVPFMGSGSPATQSVWYDDLRVTPTAPVAPGTHPNEPAGFVTVYENAYTVNPPADGAGWSGVGPSTGVWTRFFGGTHQIRTDATAPSGEGVAYGLLFNTGMVAGFGPGAVDEWSVAGGSPFSRIYFDMLIKFAGGPNGDLSTWDFHGGVNKFLGFFGSGGGTGNEMHGRGWGSGVGSTIDVQWLQQIPVLRVLLPNTPNSPTLTVSQWHRVEIQMDLNNGSTNGTLKLWLDGGLVLDYSDLNYGGGGFNIKHNSPTWGGGGGPSKSRDDWIYYDSMYISGQV